MSTRSRVSTLFKGRKRKLCSARYSAGDNDQEDAYSITSAPEESPDESSPTSEESPDEMCKTCKDFRCTGRTSHASG